MSPVIPTLSNHNLFEVLTIFMQIGTISKIFQTVFAPEKSSIPKVDRGNALEVVLILKNTSERHIINVIILRAIQTAKQISAVTRALNTFRCIKIHSNRWSGKHWLAISLRSRRCLRETIQWINTV